MDKLITWRELTYLVKLSPSQFWFLKCSHSRVAANSGEAAAQDESQTFQKTTLETQSSAQVLHPRQRTQNSTSPSEDILQHRLCLTVEQLMEVATHMGISRDTLYHLNSRCSAAYDLKRYLIQEIKTAGSTAKLMLTVLRLFVRPAAVTLSADNGIDTPRDIQRLPLPPTDSEYCLVRESAYIDRNQAAVEDQPENNMSLEFQTSSPDHHTQNDPQADSLTQTIGRSPQPLNSIDPVDLIHYTQAETRLFDQHSAGSSLPESGRSTPSGINTPVLASMLLSSSAGGTPCSPFSPQQQTAQPSAHTNQQRRSLSEQPHTQGVCNIRASERHMADLHCRAAQVGATYRPYRHAGLCANQESAMDSGSWLQMNQRLQQLEAFVMERTNGPQPPQVSAESPAGSDEWIRQRFQQLETEQQFASAAEARVYTNLILAMQSNLQERMDNRMAHIRAQVMADVRREIDMDVGGVIPVDNASTSSSSSRSAPPSEASE